MRQKVYQMRVGAGKLSSAWEDCNKYQYDQQADWNRRIIYI